MGYYDFQKDYQKFGLVFENKVLEILNQRRYEDRVERNDVESKRKFFDASDSKHKYEIKLDKDGEETGNVFFEMFTPKNYKSGLLVTWADYVIYGLVSERIDVVRLPYVSLMSLILKYPCKLVQGGDSGKTKGVLIPKDVVMGQDWSLIIGRIDKWW